MLSTVYKAGKVLNLFSLKQPEWGVTEIAKAMNIPKSSASAIMATLADQGLLQRMRSGRYRPGWRLFELSRVLLDTTEFCIQARKAMQELVERCGETTHLAMLMDNINDRRRRIILAAHVMKRPDECSVCVKRQT